MKHADSKMIHYAFCDWNETRMKKKRSHYNNMNPKFEDIEVSFFGSLLPKYVIDVILEMTTVQYCTDCKDEFWELGNEDFEELCEKLDEFEVF